MKYIENFQKWKDNYIKNSKEYNVDSSLRHIKEIERLCKITGTPLKAEKLWHDSMDMTNFKPVYSVLNQNILNK